MKRVFAFSLLLTAVMTFATTFYLQAQSNAYEKERVECMQSLINQANDSTAASEDETPEPAPREGTRIDAPDWDRCEP